MKEAVHYVDLTAMVEALENGQPVSEVDLASSSLEAEEAHS